MPRSTKPLRPVALLAASALTLAACTTVGPDFQAPAAPTATGYAMTGDAAPALALSPERRLAGPWWMELGSPDLDRVIRQALADSPTAAEATAALARAQSEAAAARGAALPQAEAMAGAQRERINTQAFGFTGFPSPTINLFQIGGSVTYDLDLFGGQRRAIEAAGARAEAEAQRADAAYLSLSGNVALQAVRIAALRDQEAALSAIVEDDRRLLEMVRRAQRAGGAAPSAISGGQAQLAQDEALLPPVRRDLAAARHQLALLAGRSPADWTAPDFTLAGFAAPSSVPLALPSALVRQRPDIRAAEAELHAATARIGVATAAQYPDIRLTASLTQGSIEPEDIFSYDSSGWTLGAGLTGPLFNGGQLKARRQAAEAEARAALARYQGVVLRAFVQVSDALSALAHDDEAIAALTRAEGAAQANLDDARKAFDLGGGPLLQVVDAQRLLSQARRTLIQARGQRYADLVQLYTATAADWRSARS